MVHISRFRWAMMGAVLLFVFACRTYKETVTLQSPPRHVARIQPYNQPQGDPDKGFDYIRYGGYVGNGIPWEVFKRFPMAKDKVDTVLNREGENGKLPYVFNLFETSQGQKVVSGNCFTCHASEFEGKVVLGLGNSLEDYTGGNAFQISILNRMVKSKFGKDSPEWKAYEEQAMWLKSVASSIKMLNPGINPAFRIEEASIRYRNPKDLTFVETPNFEMPEYPIGTDVPPLWNVKKKGALYYMGLGRGDFSKHLMQACLLGIHDSTDAREVQRNFVDVLAWLNELTPPQYPHPIDQQLALKGATLFEDNCSKCHGTYGEEEEYPNKIVPIHEVKTDSLYAAYALKSPVGDWYNQSWFHDTPPFAEGKASYGYMAPPLDGVWITAPYLHNASIPTLEALLNSKKRPTYWKRSMDSHDYDYAAVGWQFEEVNQGGGKKTFDTTIPGFSNVGHTFGDDFTENERKAVIEYLKTL